MTQKQQIIPSVQRFCDVMEYTAVDRIPNWEAGAWGQARERWITEGADPSQVEGSWFDGIEALGMDLREFINVNYNMMPGFERETLEKTEEYEVFRDQRGIVHKALLTGAVRGTRMCMDQYLSHPVTDRQSFEEMKKRHDPATPGRYPENWEQNIPRWKNRETPLILGRNCSTKGFYWRAREWMGTENLSFAWYDMPDIMHEMMEFFADFTIEISRPILEKTDVDYVMLAEDLSYKTGPLLSPDTYLEFIFPRIKRLIDFFKSNGVRYVGVDTDGNPEAVLPHFMDAGVDMIWPLERAADQDPVRLRKTFGKGLRLWGGVDKRELAKGKKEIDQHLRSLAPLVEEGGFIPTVDHTVPPDVSWENFTYYMEQKEKLLQGRL